MHPVSRINARFPGVSPMPPPVAITRRVAVTRLGERSAFQRPEVRLALVGKDRGDAFACLRCDEVVKVEK